MQQENSIEIYKELGSYERHFNQIQNVFKGLASTWFFAGFASIGFLYSSNIVDSFPAKLELASALITLAISTGIILFWIMDVMVYHKLLRATLEKSEELEEKLDFLPNLRQTMKKYTRVLNVRTAFSIFYIIPCFIMSVASITFISFGWEINSNLTNILITAWLGLIITSSIIILIIQRRK